MKCLPSPDKLLLSRIAQYQGGDNNSNAGQYDGANISQVPATLKANSHELTTSPIPSILVICGR